MIHVSWRRLATASCLCAAYFFVGGVLAASKHTQTVDALDHLIPRDKWSGAGLDKLTSTEQQTLADYITSLLGASRPAGPATTPYAKDRTQWRKLQLHMTKDDVRKLLGEPDTVSVSRFSESWYYVGGSVTFNSKGRLDLWTED